MTFLLYASLQKSEPRAYGLRLSKRSAYRRPVRSFSKVNSFLQDTTDIRFYQCSPRARLHRLCVALIFAKSASFKDCGGKPVVANFWATAAEVRALPTSTTGTIQVLPLNLCFLCVSESHSREDFRRFGALPEANATLWLELRYSRWRQSRARRDF